MMRIGLISDTHIASGMPGLDKLPPRIKEVLEGVDAILHAGDMISPFVLDELEEIAPVLAARGDDDPFSVDGRIKDIHNLHFEGFSLWLCHCLPFWMSSRSLYALFCYPSWNLLRDADDEIDGILQEITRQHDEVPNVIVFGHAHTVLVHRHSRLLLINPGSPTLPDHRSMPGTVAILSLSEGKADAEIIQL